MFDFEPSLRAPLRAHEVDVVALRLWRSAFTFSLPLETTFSSLLLRTLTAMSGRATGVPFAVTARSASIPG